MPGAIAPTGRRPPDDQFRSFSFDDDDYDDRHRLTGNHRRPSARDHWGTGREGDDRQTASCHHGSQGGHGDHDRVLLHARRSAGDHRRR